MIVTLSLAGSGFHPGAWRVSSPAKANSMRTIARQAEQAGCAAVLFRPNPWDQASRRAGDAEAIDLDTLPLMSSMIAMTDRIGIVAALDVAEAQPFNVARIFATLDRLSSGRSGWLAFPQALASDADTTERAVEFVEVVRKLWDSWEDEGLVLDKATGLFADPEKVHRIDHSGPWFKVRGPLNVPRPVQGQPVIFAVDPVAERAREAVARVADVVLLRCSNLGEAIEANNALRRSAARSGRSASTLRTLASVVPVIADEPGSARERSALLASRASPAMTDRVVARSTGLPFSGSPIELATLMREWVAAGACDGFDICPGTIADDVAGSLSAASIVGPSARDAETMRARLSIERPRSRYAAPASIGVSS